MNLLFMGEATTARTGAAEAFSATREAQADFMREAIFEVSGDASGDTRRCLPGGGARAVMSAAVCLGGLLLEGRARFDAFRPRGRASSRRVLSQ
jgi:hypothetical protein